MINLRYHIVSLTAVFLAVGIGLTLGSTFLDRATVENLNGQLEGLEARLGEREEQIAELAERVERGQALQEALDEQGSALLAGRLDPVPVVVVASEGVDAADVDGAVGALQVAGAQVQGLWWLSERFQLSTDADVADLATALEETSDDPARLRRVAVATLGDRMRARQEREPELPTDDGAAGETPPVDAAPAPAVEDPAELLGEVQALIDAGFILFQPVGEGPDSPQLPEGVRIVVVGGSPSLPDDVVVQPLLSRLTSGVEEPTTTVVTSALTDAGDVSEIVAVVRSDERLRSIVSTVDDLDHVQGWMATVLAVEAVGDGVVGHYGLGEGASALLPPLQAR